MNKKQAYWGIVILACFALVCVYAAVPADTIRTDNTGVSTIVVDNINCTTYWLNWHGTVYNLTEIVANITITPVSEWGLVGGDTGDWFNYTDLSGAVPVYIGLEMHPLNLTYKGGLVEPRVYDKDTTKWQLALYWSGNGTQIADVGTFLVMYHAHIEWDNPDGLTYVEPNEEQA